MNEVTVSDDRREMTIRNGYHQAELRSARPDGFTADEVRQATEVYEFPDGLIVGQKNSAWKMGRFAVHVHTGPPTWWLPRVGVGRHHVMVGWLRGMVALSWGGSL